MAERASPGDSPSVVLRAGAMALEFETESGMVRNVRWQGVEVLRGVYGAVRDADWNTLVNHIESLNLRTADHGFEIDFDATCRSPAIDFCWRGAISGIESGALVYTMDGEAKRDFLKNRIGLCVLHPALTCEGKPCIVETADGAESESQFPLLIEPRQPFRQVRALTYPIAGAWWLRTEFVGDVFETEDQRNWSDASFKTYSTPLALPFPVLNSTGARVRQQVTVSLVRRGPVVSAPPIDPAVSHPPEIALGPEVQLPALGACLNSQAFSLPESQLERLRSLQLDHFRVDLRAADDECLAVFRKGAEFASRAGASLHAAVHGTTDRVVSRLVELVAPSTVSRVDNESHNSMWLLFADGAAVTPRALLQEARRLLGPPGRLAAGTNAYLAELNRDRLVAKAADWVVFSMTPQVHASDTRTIVESLESQARMVETVRDFCGLARVMVSPISLRPRFNPAATTKSVAETLSVAAADADPRQLTSFAAAWTLASIVQITLGGASSATYFEVSGSRGILAASGTGAIDPGVHPVYHLLADLAEVRQLNGGTVRTFCSGSGWGSVQGLLAQDQERGILLLGNLSPTPRQSPRAVDAMWRTTHRRARLLDASTELAAANSPADFRAAKWRELDDGEPLSLPPWSYVRLDCRHKD